MSDAPGGGAAANRHRPDEAAPDATGRDPRARGAVVALAIAAIGTVAFAVGLRAALHRLPAEPPAPVNDSARAAAEYDSVGAARRRTTPRSPDAGQPDELPRLR